MTFDKAYSDLLSYVDPEKSAHYLGYFKTGSGEYSEGDKFLGISVPNQRKVAKKYPNMPLSEVQKLIEHEIHECRLTAVLLLVYRIERASPDILEEVAGFYLRNLQYVNNWDIVDSSCRHILGPFLENKERDLLYDLARSGDLWERRISIVTCYHFIRNNDFSDTLALADILLEDDHDLIQKAVGWMLREVGNRDLDTEVLFLQEDDRYKKMPRTMLRYAIEKFEEPIRKKYLAGTV